MSTPTYTIKISNAQRAMLALACRLTVDAHPTSLQCKALLELSDMLNLNAICPDIPDVDTVNDFTA